MKEDFLQFLWKFQKFSMENLQTTDGEFLQVLKSGIHNTESDGPDFFVSQLIIDNQKWAGNVEVHIKSSDWYLHNHQTDSNYDSVILHVVWEDDVEVYRADNSKIPVLELKSYVANEALLNYKILFDNKKSKWINCENQLSGVNDFIWQNWLERLYLERLEQKSTPVIDLLKKNKNNWEATCFCLIAKAFGGNTNGNAFFEMAQSIPFTIIQKETSVFKLEALFMGQCNMLDIDSTITYQKELFNEYQYLKRKYKLEDCKQTKTQFFRLRPQNFPTIRLSQLAFLFANNSNLLNKLNNLTAIDSIFVTLNSQASKYWNTHYSFGKSSTSRIKKTTTSFLKVVILNSILQLRFLYQKSINSESNANDIIKMLSDLGPENNNIVDHYKAIGIQVLSSLQSQALLTLKKNYCAMNKCLQCPVGVSLLNP